MRQAVRPGRGVMTRWAHLPCGASAGGATIFQDEKRRFVYVEDVVQALCHFTLHAISRPSTVRTPATFHLGGPALCSRLDVARSVRCCTRRRGV